MICFLLIFCYYFNVTAVDCVVSWIGKRILACDLVTCFGLIWLFMVDLTLYIKNQRSANPSLLKSYVTVLQDDYGRRLGCRSSDVPTWAALWAEGPTMRDVYGLTFTSPCHLHLQSKPDNFKCLGTPNLLELMRSWSNRKCWIRSNLPLLSYGIQLIRRAGTFKPDKFRFVPFHPQNEIYPHTHAPTRAHAHTHTHTHTCTRRCQLSTTVREIEVYMTSMK